MISGVKPLKEVNEVNTVKRPLSDYLECVIQLHLCSIFSYNIGYV